MSGVTGENKAQPVVLDAKGRTPEECWEAGDVFLFGGGTIDGEPLPGDENPHAFCSAFHCCDDHPIGKPWGWNHSEWERHYKSEHEDRDEAGREAPLSGPPDGKPPRSSARRVSGFLEGTT